MPEGGYDRSRVTTADAAAIDRDADGDGAATGSVGSVGT
jgi:hypothetical protein